MTHAIQSARGTTEPVELQVSQGLVAYASAYIQPGAIASQDTNEAIINAAGYIPAYQQAEGVVKIAAANAGDASAGVGARTISVTGLLSDYSVATETVTLNGQTSVNTVNSYIRVTGMSVLTVGANSDSEGIIYAGTGTVTVGVPATVYLRMPAATAVNGTNVTLGPTLAVPINYDLYISGVNLKAGISSNTATLKLKSRLLTSATWTDLYTFVTTTNASDYPTFNYPIRIPAGSEYCVTSVASGTTISASCTIFGVYIGG